MTDFPEIFESDIFFGILATIQFLLIEKDSVNPKVIARTF